jgi:2-polyprenyl-6-methoxyphenol hydroxylase-like FAD-dependent oxidoreductase
MVLTQCIAEWGATPAALRRYAQLRQPVCASVVQRARRLGAYMEAQQRGAAVMRSADEVMRQTAIDPSLFEPEPSTPQAARA